MVAVKEFEDEVGPIEAWQGPQESPEEEHLFMFTKV
jgi:hypothetical protein